MATVMHNRLQPRRVRRWTPAAQFAQAILSPTTAARMAQVPGCGAVRPEGTVGSDGATKLRRARTRRDDP